MLCKYLKNPTNSSYDEDDREFLSGFLDTITTKVQKYDEPKIPRNIEHKDIQWSGSELNSFYNVCGYLITSIRSTSRVCNTCIASVGSKTPLSIQDSPNFHS